MYASGFYESFKISTELIKPFKLLSEFSLWNSLPCRAAGWAVRGLVPGMQAPSFRRRLMIRLLLERLLITDTDDRRHWP